MITIRFALLTLAVLVTSVAVLAQKPDPEAAKKLQNQELLLLKDILREAGDLKLPENRAIVNAQVATRIWGVDEKNARELFNNAIHEAIRAQNAAETDKANRKNTKALIYGQTPRLQILNLLANRDAELALELMSQSRPARLQQLISRFGTANNNSFRYSGLGNFVRNEIQHERRIIGLASQQNPAVAKELIRKSLKNGINYEILNLIRRVHAKDPAAAAELAEEVVQRLVDTDVGKNKPQHTNTLQHFLNAFGQESVNQKQLAISEASVRNLADVLSEVWMSPGFRSFSINSTAFKAVERLFPGRAATIRQRQADYAKRYQDQNGENTRYRELIKSKVSGEELLRQAKSFSNYQHAVYDHAFRKLAEEGNIAQIEQTLKNEFPAEDAKSRLSQVYANYASRQSGKGNFDEAYNLINQIPDENSRFSSLIQLANAAFHRQREENKQYALSVLNHADALLSEDPNDQTEIRKLIQIASSFAMVEPSYAFRYAALAVDPINRFSKAHAIVSEFRNEGRVRNGEFLIMIGMDPTGQFGIGSIMKNLKKHDLSQTIDLANRFEQPEIRIALKLQMVSNLGRNGLILELPISSGRTPVFGLQPSKRH